MKKKIILFLRRIDYRNTAKNVRMSPMLYTFGFIVSRPIKWKKKIVTALHCCCSNSIRHRVMSTVTAFQYSTVYSKRDYWNRLRISSDMYKVSYITTWYKDNLYF